ncbi:PqqD family protein [Micrococcus sp.]|uniref:PqqD family protein n=1 Tax=Micrococcus sp. TaxID=1271 RepID=UPI0039C6BD97
MGLEAGRPQRLSPSAGVVWECLLGGLGPEEDLAEAAPRTEAEIVADVAAAFGLPEAEVTEGVTAFLRMLETSGVAERI